MLEKGWTALFNRLLILYLALLIFTAVMPLGNGGKAMNETFLLGLRLDYLLHTLVFVPLVPLWGLAFPRHPLLIILLAGLFLAAGCEIADYWIPYRGYNPVDLLTNLVGIMLGVSLRQAGLLLTRTRTPKN